ncbi:MAG: hypothetical protein ACOY4R_27890 [Pseudomonadota bacterium]
MSDRLDEIIDRGPFGYWWAVVLFALLTGWATAASLWWFWKGSDGNGAVCMIIAFATLAIAGAAAGHCIEMDRRWKTRGKSQT